MGGYAATGVDHTHFLPVRLRSETWPCESPATQNVVVAHDAANTWTRGGLRTDFQCVPSNRIALAWSVAKQNEGPTHDTLCRPERWRTAAEVENAHDEPSKVASSPWQHPPFRVDEYPPTATQSDVLTHDTALRLPTPEAARLADVHDEPLYTEAAAMVKPDESAVAPTALQKVGLTHDRPRVAWLADGAADHNDPLKMNI